MSRLPAFNAWRPRAVRAPVRGFPVLAFLAALALPALLSGCGAPSDSSQRRGAIELSECRLKDVAVSAWCGTWEVPENYAAPAGRKLKVHVAVLPAYVRSRAPDPLILLAGGPGQAASDIAKIGLVFDAVRRSRDIIMIDQRGTGRSHPFACKLFDTLDPVVAMMQVAPDTGRIRECAAGFDGDPRYYTTSDYLRDLEAVREALGVGQFNLWGGSYGSRVALAYLREHPDRVRSAILDGVAPTSMRIMEEALANGERQLLQTIADCAANAACRAAYPRLEGDWAGLQRDYAQPRKMSMIHPRTGAPQSLEVDFLAIDGALRTLLYSAEYSAMIPALISAAAAGDLGPLFAASLRIVGDLGQGMNIGLQLSVVCAEDAHRSLAAPSANDNSTPQTGADAAAGAEAVAAPAAAPAPVSSTVLARLAEACREWPHGSVVAVFHEPTSSDKPVLIFSGGLDPVTPQSNAELVARTLAHATQITAPGYGHLVSPFGCAPRMVARFIEDGDGERLPEDCIRALRESKRPPFFVNRLEARP